jgi:hypothetical protein
MIAFVDMAFAPESPWCWLTSKSDTEFVADQTLTMMIHTTELEKSRIHAEQRLSTDNAFSLSTPLNAVAMVGVILKVPRNF